MSSYNIITLVSNPDDLALTEPEVNYVVDMLQANGAWIENVEILSQDRAVDIFFATLSVEDAYRLLTELLANVKIDFYVQYPTNRRKKLLLSDMDSTMIGQECIDELADAIGVKTQVSEITELAMQGKLDFHDALRERMKLLKGLNAVKLDEVYDNHITINKGADKLLATMKKSNAYAVLVSGGFTYFTKKVSTELGFDEHEANELSWDGGMLDGTVKEPILGAKNKLDALSFYAEKIGVELSNSLAIGDGANDLMMLEAAGLPVAYYAKPAVQDKVRALGGLCINHTDLTTVLYVQGYKDEDFA